VRDLRLGDNERGEGKSDQWSENEECVSVFGWMRGGHATAFLILPVLA
jgi:hypothetical protein